MRLHIVFVMVLPLQHHIIDKLFVNNKDLTPCPPLSSLLFNCFCSVSRCAIDNKEKPVFFNVSMQRLHESNQGGGIKIPLRELEKEVSLWADRRCKDRVKNN